MEDVEESRGVEEKLRQFRNGDITSSIIPVVLHNLLFELKVFNIAYLIKFLIVSG